MDLSIQRRLAAEILGVGESRIRIDPKEIERVSEAITREDVKRLIREGIIYVEPVHGNSRGRWRRVHRQKVKGRRRGHGKRKGASNARMPAKRVWVARIRKMRRYLRYLRDHGIIDPRTYRRLYRLAKGGAFKSLSALQAYMRESGIVK